MGREHNLVQNIWNVIFNDFKQTPMNTAISYDQQKRTSIWTLDVIKKTFQEWRPRGTYGKLSSETFQIVRLDND